jgi:ankyrin repeat protein
LNQGADIELQLPNGEPSLLLAVSRLSNIGANSIDDTYEEMMAIISLLIKKGDNIGARNYDWQTSLLYAIAVEKISNTGESISPGTTLPSIVSIVLANYLTGKLVEMSDNRGMTPLIYAVFYNKSAVLRQILTKTKNINAQDINGNTAGHFAAYFCDGYIFNILRSTKADMSIKKIDGYTPIDIAKKFCAQK